MKVRIFSGSNRDIEIEINQWLQTVKPYVSNAIQSQSEGNVNLTVFYTTIRPGAKPCNTNNS